MTHSGSTAWPPSSTNTCEKWPTGIPPDTSLTKTQTHSSIIKCHMAHNTKNVPDVKECLKHIIMDTLHATHWLLPASCDHSCNYDFVLHRNLFLWRHKAVFALVPVTVFLKEPKKI